MTTPIKLGISGVSGRIGKHLVKELHHNDAFKVVCGLVSSGSQFLSQDIGQIAGIENLNILASDQFNTNCDVIIDFSLPDAFNQLIDACVMSQAALVSGTTGLNQEQFQKIEQAAKFIPIIWTSNFSINIQLIRNLLNIITHKNEMIEANITETHHIHKKDLPSGTALSLAQEMTQENTMLKLSATDFSLGEIKIKAVRKSNIAGIHEITIQLNEEIIEIKHQAKSPAVFASAAIQVAQWLNDKPNGLYSLNDFLLSPNPDIISTQS